MPLFEWKPEYSVSVTRFDTDHKKLFSLLNELNEAMAHGQGRFVIGNVLEELLNYTRQHFAAEERAMRMAGYMDVAQHVSEHLALTQRVEHFSRTTRTGRQQSRSMCSIFCATGSKTTSFPLIASTGNR